MPITTAAIGAAANVVNGTVNSLMQSPVYKAQANALNVQARVSPLSNQQQYALSVQLQGAQTDSQRMQILQNALSNISVAAVGVNATNTYATGLMIFGGILLLLGAAFLLTKE